MLQSNAPWGHTGYAVPTKSLIGRLDAAGHTVNVLCFYGLQGGVIQLGGIKMLPPGEDPWGHDIIESHVATTQSDLVLTNMDAWVLSDYGKRGFKWAAWHPIDHQTAPPNVVNALRSCHYPLPYTKHGEAALKAAGIANAEHMPIGIESDIFRPDPEARRFMRDHLNVPDDGFLIGMVANNVGFPLRKGFDVTFEAFANFRKKYPKTYLYVHTNPTAGTNRPDLRIFLQPLGLTMDDVLWPKGYDYTMGYSRDLMRGLYNAFDVLAVPSVGEGFLVPAVEAHACGTPVIATNCTSLPEVTCPDARYLLNKLEPKISVQGARWFFPTPKELYKGLLWAREHRGDEVMARRAREFAVEHYDWDKLFIERWLPWLERVEGEIEAGKQHIRVHGNGQNGTAADSPTSRATSLAYGDGEEKPSEWALPVEASNGG